MLKQRLLAVLSASLIFIPLILISCGPKGVVVIGMVGPESGKYSYITMGMYDGMQVFISNNWIKGGLSFTKGYTMNLIHYDDNNDPELAVKNVQRLIEMDNAACIVMATTDADAVQKAAQLCGEHKVPFYSISGALPKGKSAPYVYELLDNTERSRGMFIDWILTNRLSKKFILVETDVNEQGIGFSYDHSRTVNDIEKGGGTVVSTLDYKEVKLLDVVYDIGHSPDAEAVLYFGPYEYLIKLTERMLAKGITLPVYYIAPFEKSNVTKEEAPLLVNTIMFSYISSASTEPIMATFVETYYESYGEYPSYRAALSYEIVNLVARAIHEANTDDCRRIADTLENIETEPGIFNNMPPKELLPEQTIFIEGVEMDIVNNTSKFILYDTVRG